MEVIEGDRWRLQKETDGGDRRGQMEVIEIEGDRWR